MTNQGCTTKKPQPPFVSASSRTARSAATLLAQVADLERGARIKELRKARHLTQPVLADMVGVTLRAAQEWEAGGGISFDNARILAEKLGTTTEFIYNGPKGDTPDPFADGSSDHLERILDALEPLPRMEEKIDLLIELLSADGQAGAVFTPDEAASVARRRRARRLLEQSEEGEPRPGEAGKPRARRKRSQGSDE